MSHVGRYEITEQLGQGGMGTVYKAFDPMLARVVAVKVIAAHLDDQPDQRERFFREARAAAQLAHPNIITIHDLGEDNGAPFLAMEYLEGQDLDRRMRGPERPSLSRRLDIALSICAGIAHAHAAGVVHRDLKPANIFLTNDGQVKILDFGLARLVTSELTRSNVMLGTINYMAPEQLRGEKSDHRADIFSLGVLFYEVFGGKKPFQSDSFASTMFKILEETPQPLSELNPDLPIELVAIIERAMSKPRDERYQQTLDMLRDLEAVREISLAGDSRRVALTGDHPTRPPSGSRVSSIRSSMLSAIQTESPTSDVPIAPVPSASVAPPPRAASRTWMYAAGAAGIAVVVVIAWILLRPTARPGRLPEDERFAAAQTPSASVPTPPAIATAPPSAATAPPPVVTPVPAPAPAPVPSDQSAGAGSGSGSGTDALAAQVARATRAARAALAAGRLEDAAQAANQALALDRSNREARDLLTRIKDAQRKHVNEALAALTTARNAATRANAQDLVPQLFAAADREEAAARTSIESGQFVVAAARIDSAAALFRSAEGAARTEADARLARAKAAETHTAPPPVAVSPPPAAVPPPAPPAAPAEVPHQPAENEATAKEAIAATLDRYTAALEHRDMAGLKAVWPGLSGAQQSAIQNEFDSARSINAELAESRIDVAGTTATVSGVRRYTVQTRDGQQLHRDTATTIRLRRAGSAWVIETIRFEQPR